MFQKFLQAKHWQLFILMLGIPLLFQGLLVGTVLIRTDYGIHPDPKAVLEIMQFFPLVIIIYSGIYYGWFWAISMHLQKKLPPPLRINTRRFKISFSIPIIYLLLLSLAIAGLANSDLQSIAEPSTTMIIVAACVILPLHLLSMVGILHSMYFTAKVYKTVELQREVSFSDFVAEFFLFWFYPIGVWMLQPKINAMNEGKTYDY